MVFHTILAPSGGASDIWFPRRKVHFNHFHKQIFFKNVVYKYEKLQQQFFLLPSVDNATK